MALKFGSIGHRPLQYSRSHGVRQVLNGTDDPLPPVRATMASHLEAMCPDVEAMRRRPVDPEWMATALAYFRERHNLTSPA